MLKVLCLEPDAVKFKKLKSSLRGLFRETRGMALIEQARSIQSLWVALRRDKYDVLITSHAFAEEKMDGDFTLVKKLLNRDSSPPMLVMDAPASLTLDHVHLGWVEQHRLAYIHSDEMNVDRLRESMQQVLSRSMQVLVIDDEPDDYEMIRTQLALESSRQYETTWVNSAATARELLACNPNQFDALIVDYRMPAENGLDLIKALLEMGVERPILLVTSCGQLDFDAEAVRLISRGQMKFLSKKHLGATQISSALCH